MQSLNRFLESFDLRSVHLIASLLGALLCVYTMQLWSTGLIGDIEKCVTINGLRRLALWAMSLAFIWQVGYAEYHPAWQPWPPDLAALLAIDIFMIATSAGAYVRRSSERQRIDRPSKI